MILIQYFGTNFVFIFLFLLMLTACLRALTSVSRYLVLHDYMLVLICSFVFSITTTWDNVWVDVILYIIFSSLYILLLINILAMKQLGKRITIMHLGQLNKIRREDTKNILSRILHDNQILCMFVYGLSGFLTLFILPTYIFHIYVFLLCVYFIVVLLKVELKLLSLMLMIIISFVVGLITYHMLPMINLVPTQYFNYFSGGILVLSILLYLFHFFAKHRFFTEPSLFYQQLWQAPDELENSVY